ncbi:MAG: type II toxin-antitoxin system VapC family toxin [Cellulomonadaceae bacterium]|jgi:predicted nucleic acid-binding protein|nr:type II toxin-antitoxin system VapC family toxin [Cellulomonadaceae bacterium]
MKGYLADTNVWSATLLNKPDPKFADWYQAHAKKLWMPSVSAAEMLYGVRHLPAGRRRHELAKEIDAILEAARPKILDFTEEAASLFADFRVEQEKYGPASSTEDLQIAAIAAANGLTLATRNVKDFRHLDISIINPWETDNAEEPNDKRIATVL